MLVTRPPIDQHWLEDELDELSRLVEAGETLELVGRLSTIVGAPRRNGVEVAGDNARYRTTPV